MDVPWRYRWYALWAVVLVVMLASRLPETHAVSYTLTKPYTSAANGNLQWSDSTAWTPTGVPGWNDTVTVNNVNPAAGCLLQVTSNVTVRSLTMTSTHSRVCQLMVMPRVGLNVTDTLSYYANTLYVSGVLAVGTLNFRGYTIYGPSSQSSTLNPTRGLIQVSKSLVVSRGSYSSKYWRYISVVLRGDTAFSSDMSGRYLYCQACVVTNYGTCTLAETRFYITGSSVGADGDGWRAGFINFGTLTFPMASYSSVYYYWSMKNYGTVNIATVRWGSTYRLYATRSDYDWINFGTLNMYMCSAYFSSNNFKSPGTVNVFGAPAASSTPVGSGQIAMWQTYLNNAYGNRAFIANPSSFFSWDVARQSYISFSTSVGRTFNINALNTYGRTVIYWYGYQSTASPVNGVIGSMSLSRDTDIQLYGGVRSATTPSSTTLTISGRVPSLGNVQINGGCQVRLSSTSGTRITGRVTVYEASILELWSTMPLDFYDKVYVTGTARLTVANAPTTTFYEALTVSSLFNISNSAVTTQSTFLWNSGSVTGTGTAQLTTSGPAFIKSSSTPKTLSGVALNINRQPLAAGGRLIAEYFQYRIATNTTQRLSSIRYWPGQAISSYTLPSNFDSSSTVPTVVRLETSLQRPPRYNGNSPLDYGPSSYTGYISSDMSFTYTYAARFWFFLQIDTPGQYSFYVNNGYSIQARLWVNGVVQTPMFPYGRSRSFSTTANAPVNITLAAGTVRMRLDYFVYTSSYWNTFGKMLLIKYAGPGVQKQFIPMSKVSWKRTVGSRVDFANPDVSQNVSSAVSRMDVYQDTILFLTTSSSISIASSGLLNVESDLSIIGEVSASGARTQLVNAGELRKQGSAGVATFYLDYISRNGRQNFLEGKIDFPQSARSVISWTNANGGDWQDATNWSPKRTPVATDIVIITLPGTYKVIVTGMAQAESVFVGDGSASTPSLVVSHAASLKITDRLDIHVPTFTLYGTVDVGNTVWTGQYITGLGKGSVFISRINFAARSSPSGTSKYFRDVVFQNYGLFAVDATLDTGRLYCAGCKILNMPGGVMLFNAIRVYWQSGSCTSASLTTSAGASPSDPCAQSGLVNSGTVTVELYRSAYWYSMRIYGSGVLRAVTMPWRRQYTWSIYYPFVAGGIFQSYMSNIYFSSRSGLYMMQPTRLEVFGTKVWNGSPPPGSNMRGTSAQLINTLYQNTSIPYENTYSPSIQFTNLYGSSGQLLDSTFADVRIYGRGAVTFSNTYYARLSFSGSVSISAWGSLDFGSLRSGWTTVSLAPATALGRLTVGTNFYVSTMASSSVAVAASAIVYSNGTLALGSARATVSDLGVAKGGRVTANGGAVTLTGTATTYGELDFGTSPVTVPGTLRWLAGTFKGQALTTSGRFTIAGNDEKTLTGVQATIQQPRQLTSPPTQQAGVFAEYFQMRITSPLNPTPVRTPSAFPPFTGFDDAATQSIFWRFEDDVSHNQRNFYWGPVEFQSTGGVNTSSPYTFQYNFAVRYWTWLKVPTTGVYSFTFHSDPGVRPRLWLDGSVVIVGSTGQFINRPTSGRASVSMSLTSGYHRMRVDILQTNSYYSTNNGMLLYMSGPNFANAILPKSWLYTAAPAGGAAVQYAHPAFNATRVQQNTAASMSGGEIFAFGTPSITVSRGAVLDIQSDISYLCYSTSLCSLVNYGTVRRSGGFGPAQFYATYDNKTVGAIDQQVSSLSFVHPHSANGRITWISAVSGSWNNVSNWAPPRLPRTDDVVVIAVPGSYVVNVPAGTNANITTLLVGSSTSSASLQVAHFASLTVSDRLELRGDSVSLLGSIDAATVIWTGKTIQGSPVKISNSGLIVRKSLLISGGSQSKYLTSVTITNFGIISQDSSFDSGSLYCSGCVVKNMPKATVVLTSRYFRISGSVTAEPSGFRGGFENYGTVVFRPSQSLAYLYWDVKNFGRVVVMPWYWLTQPRLYGYGVFVNYGTVDVYLTNFYIYSGFKAPRSTAAVNGGLVDTNNGQWNFYSRPVQAGAIRGNRSPTLWREWLADVFSSGLYDGSRYCYLRFQNLRTNMYFGQVSTKGNVQIYNYYSYNYNVSMQNLDMDPSGQLYLYRVASTNYRPNIVLQASTKPHRVAFVYAYYYAGLVVYGDVIFNSGVSLSSSSRVMIHPTSMAEFQQTVVIYSSTLTIMNGPARFMDVARLYSGTLSLPGSRVTMMNAMQWSSSTINGLGGTLVVTGDSYLSSTGRYLNDVNLVVDSVPVDGTLRGFVAEYFRNVGQRQYFYSEQTTSSALSQSFEDTDSVPSFYRIESFVQRDTGYYGVSPKYIREGASSFSTTTSVSFTREYATRLSSYLNVPSSGNYTFYFRTGYAIRLRMWVDGTVRFTSSTSLLVLTPTSGEMTQPIMLAAGFHLIRIDLLLASTSYLSTTGTMVMMQWSGPSISRTQLPLSRLYPFVKKGAAYQFAAASAKYAPPVLGICASNLTVSQALTSPFSYSRFRITGSPRTISSGQLTVGARGIIELASSSSWLYSSASASRIRLNLRGQVIRTAGSGLLNLNTLYNISGTGCEAATSGSLELGVNSLGMSAATVSGTGTVPVPTTGPTVVPTYPPGVTVTWNGTRSGSWSDASNWDIRVPQGNDRVVFSTTSTVTITVSSDVTVRSMVVGTTTRTSYNYLRINVGSNMVVRDTLQLNSYQSYIYGSLTVGSLDWAGYRIDGNTAGALTILNSAVIRSGRYSTKYLRYIRVVNKGEFVTDTSMQYGTLYCQNCLIVNEASASIVSNTMRWSAASNYPSNTLNTDYGIGQPRHLTNYGNFTIVLGPARSYTYIYIAVSNWGTWTFVNSRYRSYTSVYLYATPLRVGNLTSYFVQPFFYGSYNYGPSGNQAFSETDIRMYGFPLLKAPAGSLPSLTNISNYQAHIDNIFLNATSLWDVQYSMNIRYHNFQTSTVNFGNVRTWGSVYVYISSSYSNTMTMNLVQDRYGYVQLGSTGSNPNTLVFSSGSSMSSLNVNSGWHVTMSASTVTNFLYIVGTSNCQVTLNSTTGSLKRLLVATASSLTLQSANVMVGVADIYGKINLQQSSFLTVTDLFRWTSGTITGTTAPSMSRSALVLTGYVNVTGFDLKVHTNADVIFASKTISTSGNGVLSQYFNYIDPNTNSSAPTSLNYFPSTDGTLSTGYLPSSFDDLTSTPQFQRAETSVQRAPGYYRNSVRQFTSTGGVDYTSALSFGRLFAVRTVAYLQVDTASIYTFYLRYQYGPARLWIDGRVLVAGPRSGNLDVEYASNTTRLSAGVHVLRVDVISGTSTSTVYGANVIVSYSAAGVAKQFIPDSKLFIFNPTTSTPISTAVSRTGALMQRAVINSETIMARGGSSLVIRANRQVFIAGDAFWFSTIDAGISSLQLQGTLTKIGGGIATLYFNYSPSGGTLQQLHGTINVHAPTSSSSPVFWNNTAGGMWTDASNWSPNRVPTAQTTVFIDLPGTYSVIIPPLTTVNIEDLVVGGPGVTARVFVPAQSSLVVNDRVDLLGTFYVQGTVDAGRVTLRGQYVTGSTDIFTKSKLIIRTSMSILSSSASTIYLQNIEITNYGTFSFGSNTRDINVYCQACTLVNSGTVIIQRASLRVTGAVPSFDSNNFRMGIRNMAGGAVYWAHRTSRTQYCYWDVLNNGQFSSVGLGNYVSYFRIYMYGTLSNFGSVTMYGSTMYIYSNYNGNRQLQIGSGSISVYNLPAWNSTVTSSRPYSLGPKEYIATLYAGLSNSKPELWDRYSQASIYFRNFRQNVIKMKSLVAVGYSGVYFTSNRYTTFLIEESLDFGSMTTLALQGYSSGSSIFTASGVSRLGSFSNNGYFTANLNLAAASATVSDLFLLSGNASVKFAAASRGATINFRRDTSIPSGTSMTFNNLRVVFKRRLLNGGTVAFLNGGGVVRGSFVWSGGRIQGTTAAASYLTLAGGASLKGTTSRHVSAINLGIQYVEQTSKNGAIAEYFRLENSKYQYWQSNSTDCTDNAECTPASFDVSTTPADAIRLEQSLGVLSVANYPGPIAFTPTGGIDYDSPNTFYYNYVTRRSAFLSVATAGMYRFTMTAQYRVPRIWVNGNIILTADSYTSTGFPAQQTSFVRLNSGYNLIRVDEILRSSTRSGAILYYEGPGVKFQMVPESKLWYQNPSSSAFATSQWKPTSTSTMMLSDDSVTIMDNSATLNVTSAGAIDVQTDALWYSSNLASQPGLVINAGSILKSGGTGNAIFLAQYRRVGAAQLSDSVRFISQGGSTGVFFWTNVNGGAWSDASNWMPNGVPGPNDYVFITEPGSYKVVVDGRQGRACRQLDVGGVDADVTFVIDYFSSLNVSSNMYLNSKTALLHGNLTAGSIAWSGQTITGDSHSSYPIGIRATGGFAAVGKTYTTRTLDTLQLTIGGSSIWDSSMYRLYLPSTNITVLAGGLLNIPVRYFGSTYNRNYNFQQGIINYGTVTFAASNYVVYFYDGLLNYGTIYVGRSCVTSSLTVYLHGFVGNMAPNSVMRLYNTYTSLYQYAVLPSGAQGTFELWGALYRPSQFGSIPGTCDSTRFAQANADYYNVTRYNEAFAGSGLLWQASSTRYFYIRDQTNNRPANFSSIVTRGRVEVRVYQRSSNFAITNRLDMDSQGSLNIYSGRGGYKLQLPKSLKVGTVFLNSGWNVVIPDGIQLIATNDFTIRSTMVMNFRKAMLIFNGVLNINSRAVLNAADSTITVAGNVYLYGTMNLVSCSVDFANDLNWGAATINGSETWIYIRRRVQSSSSSPLKLGGNNMRVVLEGTVARPSESKGVLAEYFQYRIGANVLSQINGFYNDSTSTYLVPQSFDDPTTEPTYSRIEPSMSYSGNYGGHYPQAYSASSSSYDSSSLYTFTYNFAVRYTLYVNIPVTGSNYKLHFTGPYYTGKYVRVWLNDSAPSTTFYSARYPQTSSVSNITFSRGYNKLRVDVIQSSSYWNTVGNMLYVSYELPGVLPKTVINNQNSYYRQSPYWTGTGSPYPAPSFQVLTNPVCNYEADNATYRLCNNFDAGVSCWKMSRGSYVNSQSGPSIWVSSRGVLDVSSSQNWTYNGTTRLTLLNSGIISRGADLSTVNLDTQFASSGGCNRLQAAGEDRTVILGVSGLATFPPTTEPPPTLPPPTTQPPAAERGPTTWSSVDVQEWIATVGGGEFAPLGKYFRDFTGIQLLELSRDEFIARVTRTHPELKELATQLYDMLATQHQKYSPVTSSNTTGIAVGAAVGAAALLAVILLVVFVSRRRSKDTGGITFNGQRSKRLSEQPVLEMENPGYMTGAGDSSSMPRSAVLENMGKGGGLDNYDRASAQHDKAKLAAEEVCYDPVGGEQFYEDVGAEPGHYANHDQHGVVTEDIYEDMR